MTLTIPDVTVSAEQDLTNEKNHYYTCHFACRQPIGTIVQANCGVLFRVRDLNTWQLSYLCPQCVAARIPFFCRVCKSDAYL